MACLQKVVEREESDHVPEPSHHQRILIPCALNDIFIFAVTGKSVA